MKFIIVFLLMTIFIACGEKGKTELQPSANFIDFVFYLAQEQSGQPDQSFMNALYEGIEKELKKVKNIDFLKQNFDLSYRLHHGEITAIERKEWKNRISRVDKLNLTVPPLFIASESCIYRMGKIGNDAAAKALIEIYQNPKYSFDGESALNLLCAMKSCGKPLLPYLEKQKDDIFIQSAIECIVKDKPCI